MQFKIVARDKTNGNSLVSDPLDLHSACERAKGIQDGIWISQTDGKNFQIFIVPADYTIS